jgi:hypothetical protein
LVRIVADLNEADVCTMLRIARLMADEGMGYDGRQGQRQTAAPAKE